MYRILNLTKDTYITNKIIAGSGSIESNVGQAGTLDLFKIYTYISSSISGNISTRELSRILINPDLSPITEMVASSGLSFASPSFKCYLNLKDVYGGQTTPSNFTVVLNPLASDWNEGRGSDIKAFRDLDTANWVSASSTVGWVEAGASSTGSSNGILPEQPTAILATGGTSTTFGGLYADVQLNGSIGTGSIDPPQPIEFVLGLGSWVQTTPGFTDSYFQVIGFNENGFGQSEIIPLFGSTPTVITGNALWSSITELIIPPGSDDLGTFTTGLAPYILPLNTSSIDYYSGSYTLSQTFARGDEDLLIDVTSLVSATLAGIIPDHGWRLALSSSHEEDNNSYFVKRFGSRHTTNPALHPKLIVNYDESLRDDSNCAFFGSTNVFRTYNSVNGTFANFTSGSYPGTQVVGNSCLNLVLIASKSISFVTSSWQNNFSASISYVTSSVQYISAQITSNQASINGNFITGSYVSFVTFDPTGYFLRTFLGTDKSLTYQTYWQSLDGTQLYSSGSWITFRIPESSDTIITERNFVVNVTNLKIDYVQDQVARLRVFIQDLNTEQPALRLSTPAKSLIFQDMQWRLVNAFTRKVVIPFTQDVTKLSSDATGMYFDMYMEDLDANVVYEFEFKITENLRSYYIANEGFRFKVIP